MATIISFNSKEAAELFLSEAKRIRQKALDHGIKRLSTAELYQLAVYHQGITVTENRKTMQLGDRHEKSYRLICAEIAERMIHEPADRDRPIEEELGKLFDAVKDGIKDMLKAKCQENLENCRKLEAYFDPKKTKHLSLNETQIIYDNNREASALRSRLEFALELEEDQAEPNFYAEQLAIFNKILKNESPRLAQTSNPIALSILDKLVETISNLLGLTTYAAAQSARSNLINENRYEPLLTVAVTYNEKQFKEKLVEIRKNSESLQNLRNDLLQDLGRLVEKCDPIDEKTLITMQKFAEPIVKKIDKVDKILDSDETLVGGIQQRPTLSVTQENLIKLGKIGLNFMKNKGIAEFIQSREEALNPTAHTTLRR